MSISALLMTTSRMEGSASHRRGARPERARASIFASSFHSRLSRRSKQKSLAAEDRTATWTGGGRDEGNDISCIWPWFARQAVLPWQTQRPTLDTWAKKVLRYLGERGV